MNTKIFAAIGVSDFKSYLFKYFLPIFLLDFLVLFVFLFGFEGTFLKITGLVLFFFILIVLFAYPMILIDNQTRNIEENLHYFITYAGALSTVNLERKDMFADLSDKIRYREIANVFKKLIYLVESIKIDFSTASYKMAGLMKSEHFARFLERMGIALSFNANVSKFMLEEQKALMNSYAIVYQEGLERIKLVQEMFVSLVLAFSFVLATVLLLPFLTGLDTKIFLQFGVIGIVMLDVSMIVFSKFFLPKDQLYHTMGYDDGRKKILLVFVISLLIALVLFPFLYFASLPVMLKFAIGCSPFLLAGMYSNYQEKMVINRDIIFPAFIRSLGDVHQSKGGTLTTTVETLLPHNFGILNGMLERVYKRLKITSDKFNSWYYFSKESGSALISEFMDIFVSVVYRGGSAQIAGEIVSDNMTRINGLRDMKKEFASTLKGSVYGTFFGIAATMYIALLISVLLFKIFTSLTADVSGMAADLMSSVLPTNLDTVSIESMALYAAAILVSHSLISAFLIKEVDGGNKFTALTDFVIMLWLGAIIEIALTALFKGMFAQYFG
ncbi:MAG: hypothetical protein ACOCXG_03995 [Nanoarchaeota archaeon]